MIREPAGKPSEIGFRSARALKEANEALRDLEGVVAADVMRLLSETTANVQEAVEGLQRSRPEDWLTPEMLARRWGYDVPEDGPGKKLAVEAFEKVAAAEGVPYHRLSPRRKLYNVREVDAWLLGR